jgi:hypothetical protein
MSALHSACTTRLTQLRQDLVHGRRQVQALQETLLRIEGAVQVLEEVLAEGGREQGVREQGGDPDPAPRASLPPSLTPCPAPKEPSVPLAGS